MEKPDFTNYVGEQIKIEHFYFETNEYVDINNNLFWAISIYLKEPKEFKDHEIMIEEVNNIYREFLEVHFSVEKYKLLKEKFQSEEQVNIAFEKFNLLH